MNLARCGEVRLKRISSLMVAVGALLAWLACGYRMQAATAIESESRPAQGDSLTAELSSLLARQTQAWNRGDLEEYMQTYWKSEELTFSAGGRTTRGWQATLDRYRKRYATPEQMGTLTFGQLETRRLGPDASLMLGVWKLDRRNEPVEGNFSLVWQRIDGRWVIVHDHSSMLEPG